MAAPVISPITSILKATVGKPFLFQLTATNLPKPRWVNVGTEGGGSPEPWGAGIVILSEAGLGPYATWPVGTTMYPVSYYEAGALAHPSFFINAGVFNPDPAAVGEGALYTEFQSGKPLTIAEWDVFAGYTPTPVVKLLNGLGTVVSTANGTAGLPPAKNVALAFAVWQISGLPPGLTFSQVSGRISGTPTVPFVGVITITCSNQDGSHTISVPFGVETSKAASAAGASVSIPLVWDLDTGVVTGPGEGAYTGPREKAQEGGEDEFEIKPAQLVLRSETKPPVAVSVRQGGVVRQLAFSEMYFAVRELQTEPKVDLNDGAILVAGDGESTAYEIILDVAKAKVGNMLGNYEDDANTGLYAFGELRAKMLYDNGAAVVTIPLKSRAFYVRIEQSF